MNNDPSYSHLLQKHGILPNFSIRKKMTQIEFHQIMKKATENAMSEDEAKKNFEKLTQLKKVDNVPGIIIPTKKEQRTNDIIQLAEKLAEFVYNYKMSPEEAHFFFGVACDILGRMHGETPDDEEDEGDEDDEL